MSPAPAAGRGRWRAPWPDAGLASRIALCGRVVSAREAQEISLDQFVLVVPNMPAPFPHHYSTSLSRTFASRARIQAPPRAALEGGPSPELDGDVHAWSPEQMLLSSLGLCMLTTFEAFAARDGIEVLRWDAKVGGTVEQTPEGRMFTSIVLELDMELAGNVDRTEATLEDAKQYCLVLNSLRVPVVIEAQLHTPDELADEWPQPDIQALASRDRDLGRRDGRRDQLAQRRAS
jgi:organic hydroperoxide reductase OsmC/OhrA